MTKVGLPAVRQRHVFTELYISIPGHRFIMNIIRILCDLTKAVGTRVRRLRAASNKFEMNVDGYICEKKTALVMCFLIQVSQVDPIVLIYTEPSTNRKVNEEIRQFRCVFFRSPKVIHSELFADVWYGLAWSRS